MPESVSTLILRESRAARRLARLFKIEGGGGFERWPLATIRRLIERRAAIVNALLQMERERRALAAPHSAELDRALTELAREVGSALQRAQRRVDQLDKELQARRGASPHTGIRATGSGQLLGRS
jgi:hypothetical protein